MKKTTIAVITFAVAGFVLASVLYRLATPHGVIRPIKGIRATMQTENETIAGTVHQGRCNQLLYVRFPESPSFHWFKVDMQDRFVSVPNRPQRIIGRLYRPMGLGVLLTSPKIQDEWHVFVNEEQAIFSNAVVRCTVEWGLHRTTH